jgi:hypothetical protein
VIVEQNRDAYFAQPALFNRQDFIKEKVRRMMMMRRMIMMMMMMMMIAVQSYVSWAVSR